MRFLFWVFWVIPIVTVAQSGPTSAPTSIPVSICGNLIQEPGEACDDGNNLNGDGCRSDCKVMAICGEKVEAGEICTEGREPERNGVAALGLSVAGAWLSGSILGASFEEETPGVLRVAGVLLFSAAPSAGFLYARAYGRAALTSSVRLVTSLWVLSATSEPADNIGDALIGALLITAIAAPPVIAATSYDIIGAPFATREHKRKISLVPSVSPVIGRGAGFTLGLSLQRP